MIRIIITLIAAFMLAYAVTAFALESEPTTTEPISEPIIEQTDKTTQEPEKASDTARNDESDQKIDPNGCEAKGMMWRADNFECIPRTKPAAAQPAPTGDWVARCHAWAAQAGTPLNSAAIKLLERESKCDPTARNPYSSAGGIPQALPWTKMGCELSYSDSAAICQLRWFKSYVDNRYGSYEAALAHSYAHNWY